MGSVNEIKYTSFVGIKYYFNLELKARSPSYDHGFYRLPQEVSINLRHAFTGRAAVWGMHG